MPNTSQIAPTVVSCYGGLVLNKDIFSMRPGEALQLTNFEPDIAGGYKKMLGTFSSTDRAARTKIDKSFKDLNKKEMFKQLKLNIEVNSIKNVKIFNANPSSDKEILFCKSDKKKIEKFDNLIGEIKVANQNNLNNKDCQKIIIKKIDSLKFKRKVS